ncbi:MAG TPA: rod shape-determining protein MreD [Acidobacteriaceae bacterium]|jgi:rod shape-determining protein MreD|nr:rod shape-determining protein MreD [Acidobacteriaceae bacterium]
MPLMASSRHEVGTRSYPFLIYVLTPVLALGLQSLLSLHFTFFDVIDLPLLVTIYYGITKREPMSATVVGAAIGIAQDALTHHALGIFGIAKSVVGYIAASLGVRVDTENHGTRLMLTFAFTLVQTAVLFLLQRHMLGQPVAWHWVHELIKAAVNALVGVVLFALLDQTRRRE